MQSRRVNLVLAFVMAGATAIAQAKPPAGLVVGHVLDPSDALIPGASIILMSGNRELARSNTDAQGEFRFDAVPPGRYEVRVECTGFVTQRTGLNLGRSTPAPLRIVMSIAELKESLTVDASDQRLDTASAANADTIRFTPEQLADLPFINGDLIAALSQLLGPSALGSEGPSIIVDGLPTRDVRIPLSAIQEVTINNNPYSAEFARPGRARIEIITKSGSAKYHGSLSFSARDYRLDARNALADVRAPQERKQVDADFSGPLYKDKQHTFSLALSRIDDRLEPTVYAFGLTGPILQNASRRQASSYASGQYTRRIGGNAASFRYTHFDWSDTGEGTGGFVLPAAGTDSTTHYDQLYSSFQGVISQSLVNVLSVRLRAESSA